MRQNKNKYLLGLCVVLFIGLAETNSRAQPVNDLACDALELTIDDTCSFSVFTNLDAESSGIPDPGCGEYEGGDVWFYAIIPLSGSVQIQTDTEAEEQFPLNNGWMYHGAMALYTGSCTSLSLLNCYEDNGMYHPRMAGATISGQTPGDTIWIRIWGNSNNDNGMFKICATGQEQGACPSRFTVLGGGGFCEGEAGVPVSLSGSESGFLYTLLLNDTIIIDTLMGNGDSLKWASLQEPGTYKILAHHPVDTCSILMNDSASVTVLDVPQLSFEAVSVSCFEEQDGAIETTITGGTEPFQTSWAGPGGFTSGQLNLIHLGPGEYTLTVSDFNGCMEVGPQVSISEPALLVAILEEVTHLTSYVENDGAIQLAISGGSVPYSVSWTGTDGYVSNEEDPTGMTVGTYGVMVTDDHLCQDSIRMIVVSLAEDAEEVFIPEGFSPNGDGYNDRFVILGIETFPENELVIFNSQGVEVFHSVNYKNDWDGRPEKGVILGGILPEGTYYYVFKAGNTLVRKGFVYLNRE